MNRRQRQKDKFLAKAKQKELTTLERIGGILRIRTELGRFLADLGMLKHKSDWAAFHGMNDVAIDVARAIGDPVLMNSVENYIDGFRKHYYEWKENA